MNPSPDICCNHADVDPISLEDIKDLTHYFYCTTTSSGRVEAYDAVAWLQYFLQTPDKWPNHPCTRMPLQASDIWDCYLAALQSLGPTHADVVGITTNKVYAQVKGNVVSLRARSPLFSISICSLKTDKSDGDTKTIHLTYNLVNSTNPTIKHNPDPYTLTLTVPDRFSVSVGH